MGIDGGSTADIVLDAFDRFAGPNEPLTADEVVDVVDYGRPTVEKTLEALVDRDWLRSKTIGDGSRVWWRPPSSVGYVDEPSESAWESRELYRLTLANLSDTVLVTDDDGEFTYVCPNVHFIFGYEAEEVAEMGTADALLGADLFDPGELERNGEIKNIERTVTDKSGDEHHLLITVKSVSIGAGSLLFACRDVTERKRREAELREARVQNDRLERFADMLAHELRSPLEIAQIYLEFAEDGDQSAFEEVAHAHARIEETIDLLLVLAKGTAAITDVEPVDLEHASRRAWTDIEAASSELEVESPPTIRAQSTHVQHLLANLLRNAVEHGSRSSRPGGDDAVENGSTSPRSADEAVREGGEDVTVRVGALDTGFYVTDDGPGIPSDEREAVFEPGYTTDSQGTGLGLTFVAQLADAYGWEYSITENTEGGARFEFRDVDVAPSEQ